MFLRIDKVTGSPNGPPSRSNDSMHACLATSSAANDSTNDTGELFVIGRKNTAVTVDDKCVSRKHASIHLLTKTPPSQPATLPECLQGRILMEYGTPSTPEEIAACESSTSGVICVLRDLGSKFGTFVQVDEDLLAATTPRTSNASNNNNDDGGDETEDETDDEGINDTSINYVTLSEKQAQAVHLLSGSNNNNHNTSVTKFQKVEANKSITLLPLSHSNNTSTSSSTPPHIIILFGSIGSAIRLTLLPLQFTFSSISPKTTLQSYTDTLHYIGATHNQWDVNKSTHLVATEKKANAKAIAAWAAGRAVVSLGYLDGLLGRRVLGDGLPREEDFPPKGTSQLDSLSYSGDHSTSLQGYCIAVMMEDDNGPLAQSAGAKILKVYEDAPNSSQSDFDTWWNTQQQIAIDAKMVLVLVDSKSSKCKPYNTWLHKRRDVRLTSAKHLAQAITGNNGEGSLLLDSRKETIEKMEGWDAVVEEAIMDVDKSVDDIEIAAADNDDEEVVEVEEEKQQQVVEQQDEVQSKSQAAQEVHAGEKRTKQNDSNKAAANNEETEASQPQKKRRRKEQSDEPVQEEEANAMEQEPTEDSRAVSFDANIDAQSDDEPGLPDERIPLPTTSDGWLVAAPRSRKAYRKAIEETEAENPTVSAETEKVNGLVVRAYVKPAAVARPGRTVRRGKDFKGFRKNTVIRGFSSSEPKYADYNAFSYNTTLPTIRLVSVLPKESERQRQLEMQQQELEREQEIADSLFNDTSGGKAKRGRKKSGNASIHQYFSQVSTTKKGRGRR